jgi:hypothetical protein
MIALFREVVLRVFSRRAPAEILQITENESLAAQVARESTGRGRLELRHSCHKAAGAQMSSFGKNGHNPLNLARRVCTEMRPFP